MEKTDVKLDGKSRPLDLDKTCEPGPSETKMSNLIFTMSGCWSQDIASVSIDWTKLDLLRHTVGLTTCESSSLPWEEERISNLNP